MFGKKPKYSADKLVKLILFREDTAPDLETAVNVLCRIHPEISRERASSLVHVEGISFGFPESPESYAIGRLLSLCNTGGWPDYSKCRWWIHRRGRDPRTGGRTIILRIYRKK